MSSEANNSTISNKRKAEWFDLDDDHNTYVYVSGLPTSITEDEFVDLMKKYGIIAKKPVYGAPFNIKLYKNRDGTLKGDALCCYVKKESVELALKILEGYSYDDKHVLHCERAKFELKGSYDPTKKPRVVDQKSKLKQKKTVQNLFSWDPKLGEPIKQKKVILKNMFTPDEIAQDAKIILDLKMDVEERCTELIGEPKRVDIYDTHPEGVVAVTFSDHRQAETCVEALNNQPYAGRLVKAELWDGKTRYKAKETEEEAQKRIEKYHKDIQEDEADSDDTHQADDTRNQAGDSNEANLDRDSEELTQDRAHDSGD